MKVGPKPDTKGYTVSSIVVRNDGSTVSVLEKLGLVAALAIALFIALWVAFVVIF